MKVMSVVGARPQFIKAAVVCRALADVGVEEVLVHTGQHYDRNMSGVFFDELGIPRPKYDLEVGSGGHAYQTGQTMERLEPICKAEKPDSVVVYGDTNATLGGALVAAKLNVPLAHVEAGLRSFDRRMPEEVNRVVTDHLAKWLFCPTQTAVENMGREGVEKGAFLVGDVMYDATLRFRDRAYEKSDVLKRLEIESESYYLVTIHRDFNTDDRFRLSGVVGSLCASKRPVVFPAHPRVVKQLQHFGLLASLRNAPRVRLVDPVSYLDMVRLESAAYGIVTDSGGVQKEAFFLGIPCLTVRPSSEWVETLTGGWNRLVEPDPVEMSMAMDSLERPAVTPVQPFGDGTAGKKIAEILLEGCA